MRAAARLILTGAVLAACSPGSAGPGTAVSEPFPLPDALQLVVDHADAPANDVIQVFVCAVPSATTDPIYGDLPMRLALAPEAVTQQMESGVRPYFEALSHGLYHPHFTAGTTVAMTDGESHDACVDRALDASATDATVVMVVATAQHTATDPGGWGRPGTACAVPPCPARQTRRALYVGASDFTDANPPGSVAAAPLLDLIEHELGHTLDLPHSAAFEGRYTSGLDVMSDSAAPRDVEPDRIHAQDTLAVNRLALGWLPGADVAVAPAAGGRFELWPSTGSEGRRLLVLPVTGTAFLTVEYLPATGFDGFLPHPGVAVHRIEQAPTACGRSAGEAACTGIDRVQTPVGGDAPYTELLHAAADRLDTDGWTISLAATVDAGDRSVQVEVHPTDR